ncbi:hypothetical protein FRB94_003751 [Tulasnella sp. JGI-2019a]|nr:hypothetical protein FRB93_000564 [Tulasnella sp. JGI-2019a]KAG8985466.1 hypothetical protein FRB94_003751 [Tulasnella sp. JGI-2019a]
MEFAVLKFTLDKFNQYIFGLPIVLETNCQALRDLLLKVNLSVTHAWWRDAILAAQIVDVWHRPGVENKVPDAISRKWADHEGEIDEGEGQEWTVTPNWEDSKGLVNDMMAVEEGTKASEL